MPQGGTLRIGTTNVEVTSAFARRHPALRPGRYVALTVADSGCGMTPDVLAHVFEPFFTTKPVGKGTGLGLATVYGIVKQSDGYVSIDSTPGTGTTVTVYLPSIGGAPLVETATIEDTRANGQETILLVEDDPRVRELMHRTLERSGYRVLKPLTAREAIAWAAEPNRRIDLLLSDVVMPDVGGAQVAQHVVHLHPGVKVLFVSGFANEMALVSAALNGRGGFLAKPFSAQALTNKVRECLDAQS
jgi:two-component system, cell cycle sensor histidine kinase and response regulator CckA